MTLDRRYIYDDHDVKITYIYDNHDVKITYSMQKLD